MTPETALSPLLNEELIERALRNYHTVEESASVLKVKYCDFKRSPASGENFCSDIYQADVKYELNGNADEKSLIIKIMLPEVVELGSNEEQMFKTVLPAMEKILNFKNVEEQNKLHAKCLVSERKKEEYYVLENLNSLGYYCADRVEGLDLAHALILMKKIAQFHGASMLFAKRHPDVIEALDGSHFEKGACDTISQSITFGGLEYAANMIENWPGYEDLPEKLRSIIPRFNSTVRDVVNAEKSKFNVLVHGDLWVNNFLYKYGKNTKTPLDLMFVDFQNCFWGSCGFDINWFLNTSLKLNVLIEHRQQLIQAYFDELYETLVQINYPTQETPTLQDVLDEIKRCEFIGLYTAVCELPIVALDKSKSQGFNSNTFGKAEKMKVIRVLMYDNPRIRDSLKYTLKYFQELTIL